MSFEILGLITARGGSKTVPRKNIKELAGKPLLAYTIEEARKTGLITRLVISTDCEEIATVAREYSCEVPFLRPSEFADDHVQDLPVFEHALGWLREEEGYAPDMIVHLRPTAPLRRVEHIEGAIETLISHPGADSVRSVCLAPKHPLKMWRIEEERLRSYIPAEVSGIKESYNYPRQKLPEAYVQNGSVDVIRTATIAEKRSMSGDLMIPYLMDEEDSINIDTFMDFKMAEILLGKRQVN
ncbi:N-acylneuraminate cytidylyltransferase [hydrothermal vent metagenome]|uniref:N-acylneuraminate cytidylyltransferase n=1 Tax=hydrothermal vent metagenome TaxID=652676 RepID=A0A3B0V5F7_9ZZZZ